MKQKPAEQPSSSEMITRDIKRKTSKQNCVEENTRIALDVSRGVPRTTFYRWYAHHCANGEAALRGNTPLLAQVWNCIPDTIREQVISPDLDCPEPTPYELAVTFRDSESHFVSESSVYQLLKAHEFTDKTTAINQKWQGF